MTIPRQYSGLNVQERLEGDETTANQEQLVQEGQKRENQVAGSEEAGDGDDHQGSTVQAVQTRS